VGGDKFLQTSHAPKARHRLFSPLKCLMSGLGPIVEPSANFLFSGIANDLYRSAIRLKFVSDDNFWAAMALNEWVSTCGLNCVARGLSMTCDCFSDSAPPGIPVLRQELAVTSSDEAADRWFSGCGK